MPFLTKTGIQPLGIGTVGPRIKNKDKEDTCAQGELNNSSKWSRSKQGVHNGEPPGLRGPDGAIWQSVTGRYSWSSQSGGHEEIDRVQTL